MPTRNKVVARNGSQEHASPRFCRQQKKVTVIAEKKVDELITSAKKQKPAGVRLNKTEDVEETKDLNTAFTLAQDDVAHGTSLDDEVRQAQASILLSMSHVEAAAGDEAVIAKEKQKYCDISDA